MPEAPPVDGALTDAVRAIAGEAAACIMTHYGDAGAVRSKADDTPVTAADLAANAIIVAGLRGLGAGWPVLSEEGPLPPARERARWRAYWLVDPLDGTRGFIHETGHFTVNVALVEDHRPVLGVVWCPVSGECYTAHRGGGAIKHSPGGKRRRIRARRADPARLVVATSRSRSNERVAAFIEQHRPAEVVRMGSSLKSCLVAEGAADAYPGFSRTSEWDTAAAQCVVEEAGGAVTDLERRPLEYNRRASVANPRFLVVGDAGYGWRLPAAS